VLAEGPFRLAAKQRHIQGNLMQGQPVLYVIASGAAPARDLPALVADLTADWDVCVISTPEGIRFFDAGQITALTGYPVRTSFKDPDAPDVLPPPSAFAAAPATFNTINKWAAGISDTLALALLNEAIGLWLPIVTAPWPNAALARHPAFDRSVATLRDCGITVVLDHENLPGADAPGQPAFPWERLRAEIARIRGSLAPAEGGDS
jgi:phosphopantothenoylcysteine synthetase/decarboxylase